MRPSRTTHARTHRRAGRSATAAAVAALLALGLAPTAAAAPAARAAPAGAAAPAPTVCGRVADFPQYREIPGDLVVDGTCYADGLLVAGDVRVLPGSSWPTYNSRVRGDVHVGDAASVHLTDVDVRGGLHLDRAASVTVIGVVGLSVRGRADAVTLAQSRVGGAVNVTVPAAVRDTGVRLLRSEVGGWVNVHGGRTEVAQSWLHRGLTLTAVRASTVTESLVDADVTVRQARARVHVGDRAWWPGPPGDWAGTWLDDVQPQRSRYAGSLLLLGNAGPVTVGHVDVAGALTCTGGRPAPVIDATVTVGGARTGQCA